MGILANGSRRRAALLSILAFALAPLGCREQEVPVPEFDPPQRLLRIGLVPEHNLFAQKKRYQPIADYLSKKARVRVELKIFSPYGNIIEDFAKSRLDGAFFGSFTAALAHRQLQVEPLARPEYADGSSTYRGLLFVRRDSGIRQVEQMQGKRFAFVDRATTAGWLLPLHYFKSRGIADYRSWLKESYFSGSHEGVIYDVLERRADIGAAKSTVFNRLALENPRISRQLLVLAHSPAVPENALCVRGDLDVGLKRVLKDALLTMDRSEEGRKVLAEFGAARFVASSVEGYAVVLALAEEVGFDVNSHDFSTPDASVEKPKPEAEKTP